MIYSRGECLIDVLFVSSTVLGRVLPGICLPNCRDQRQSHYIGCAKTIVSRIVELRLLDAAFMFSSLRQVCQPTAAPKLGKFCSSRDRTRKQNEITSCTHSSIWGRHGNDTNPGESASGPKRADTRNACEQRGIRGKNIFEDDDAEKHLGRLSCSKHTALGREPATPGSQFCWPATPFQQRAVHRAMTVADQ